MIRRGLVSVLAGDSLAACEWLEESSFGFASHADDDFSFGAPFSKIPERFRNLT